MADKARAEGQSWGVLHGLPMTVKDVHNVAGWPTTYGDPRDADWRPGRNSSLVDKLIGAGRDYHSGKTNVPLHSADFQSFNAGLWFDREIPGTLLDHREDRPEDSAAALASGFLPPLSSVADIAGSIRFPAHFCGVFGHKPTHGILSDEGNLRRGTWLASDLATAGPLARSAADLELLLQCAGRVRMEPAAKAWLLNLPGPRAVQAERFSDRRD